MNKFVIAALSLCFSASAMAGTPEINRALCDHATTATIRSEMKKGSVPTLDAGCDLARAALSTNAPDILKYVLSKGLGPSLLPHSPPICDETRWSGFMGDEYVSYSTCHSFLADLVATHQLPMLVAAVPYVGTLYCNAFPVAGCFSPEMNNAALNWPEALPELLKLIPEGKRGADLLDWVLIVARDKKIPQNQIDSLEELFSKYIGSEVTVYDPSFNRAAKIFASGNDCSAYAEKMSKRLTQDFDVELRKLVTERGLCSKGIDFAKSKLIFPYDCNGNRMSGRTVLQVNGSVSMKNSTCKGKDQGGQKEIKLLGVFDGLYLDL